jgi:hypothetical protein
MDWPLRGGRDAKNLKNVYRAFVTYDPVSWAGL